MSGWLHHLTEGAHHEQRTTAMAPGSAEPYEVLRERVAEALFWRELAYSRGATDLGLLGPAYFLGLATDILNAIAVGSTGDGPPSP